MTPECKNLTILIIELYGYNKIDPIEHEPNLPEIWMDLDNHFQYSCWAWVKFFQPQTQFGLGLGNPSLTQTQFNIFYNVYMYIILYNTFSFFYKKKIVKKKYQNILYHFFFIIL